MASINLRKSHGTTLENAIARTRVLVDTFVADKPEFFKSVRWNAAGDHADADGRGFSGTFDVSETEVRVVVKLSFLVSAFKGRVEASLERRFDDEFGK